MEIKIVSTNRKALRDFQIIETYEAGISLRGCEVKSIRNSNVNLQDSYCKIVSGEVILYNMHIARFEKTSSFSPETKRPRKLLLHKKEISRLKGKISQGNLALIPINIYFNAKGIVKIKIGISKKLKGPDKREIIRKHEIEKELRNSSRWDG